MPERLPHWKVMERFDPDLLELAEPWREKLLTEGPLTRRETELVMAGMCAVVRFGPGFDIHAGRALEHGATDAEVFHAVALSQLIGGVPAYRESALWLERLLAARDGSGADS